MVSRPIERPRAQPNRHGAGPAVISATIVSVWRRAGAASTRSDRRASSASRLGAGADDRRAGPESTATAAVLINAASTVRERRARGFERAIAEDVDHA